MIFPISNIANEAKNRGKKKKPFFFSPHCSNDCTLNNLFPPIPHFCPSLTIPQACFSIFPSAPVPLVIQAMARGIPHSRIGFPSHSALLSIWKHTSPLFLLLPHAAILQLPCREALCPTLWEWQHHCLAEKERDVVPPLLQPKGPRLC